MDAEYLRLKRAYERAANAFQIALEKRRRFRKQAAERRRAPPRERRPVGMRPGAEVRKGPPLPPPPPPLPRAHRVDMGDILGWQEFDPFSPKPFVPTDPTLDLDLDAMFDRMSLLMYRRAKQDYQRARRAFLDYERAMHRKAFAVKALNARRHLVVARRNVAYGAMDQLLGWDAEAEDLMKEARQEVIAYCGQIWEAYRNAPEGVYARRTLLAALGEAQLVDADDDEVVTQIQLEVNRLIDEAPGGVVENAPPPPGR